MKFLSVLALCIVTLEAQRVKGLYQDIDWEAYKSEYNKVYEDEEDAARYKFYVDEVNFINSHNAEYDEGKLGYWVGLHEYSDMSPEERKARNGFVSLLNEGNGPFREGNYEDLPDSVNWTAKGAVTPIKDQKLCGSCWAFGATGALEGQTLLHFKKLPSLSEQQLVSCDGHSLGCFGGNSFTAFKYIHRNKGIVNETSYPYKAKNSKCDHSIAQDVKLFAANDTGGVMVKPSEDALTEAVANVGPIQVNINAALKTFHSYKGGVYDDMKCKGHTDHSVLVVGYGVEDGKKIWIVKNSWGTSWGLDGYVHFLRGTDITHGICSIASAPSYPSVKDSSS